MAIEVEERESVCVERRSVSTTTTTTTTTTSHAAAYTGERETRDEREGNWETWGSNEVGVVSGFEAGKRCACKR